MRRSSVVIAFAALTTGCSKPDNSPSVDLSGPPAAAAPKEPALAVKMLTFATDWEENSANAVAKYKNNFIEVSGPVDHIPEKGLQLGTSGLRQQHVGQTILMCRDLSGNAAALKKGQRVTIRGTCTGKEGSETVWMKGCSLVGP